MQLILREKHNNGDTLWYDFVNGDLKIGQCQIKLVSHDGNSLYYEVFEQHRNKGNGKILLALALDEMQNLGIKQASILCDPANDHSVKLLESELGEGRLFLRYIFNL